MKRIILCLLLSGVLLALGSAPLAAQAKETRITIAVECGAQGVVDDDWTIEFDLCDPQGNKVNTTPIKISVPDGTGSRAAADRMATAVNIHAGANVASRQETTHQSYGGDTGKLKAEDVVLTGGYMIKNVKTFKEGKPRCGHLKVYQGKKRINNKRIAAMAADGRLRGERVASSVVIPGDPLESIFIDLVGYSTPLLGIHLLFGGVTPDGFTAQHEFDQVFDGASTPTEVTTAIGTWAQSLGHIVEYPTATSVRLTFDAAILSPDWWHFTAYIATDPSDPDDGQVREVTFTAH